jgi:hypothetical protein
MTDPTDKELAAMLLEEAEAPGAMSRGHVRLAAQRLSREISEAGVKTAAKTLYAQHRAIENVALPKWDELTDFQRYAWTERARAALEIAREG